MKSKTIVLIHGMFMNSLCWEKWIPYYESKGYKVYAPNWPGRDKSVEELNKAHPDPELAKLKLNHIVDAMEAFIKRLEEKPAIIGHSMGGLVVQLLLQRDVAVAGVAIDPAPPAGVNTALERAVLLSWLLAVLGPLTTLQEPVPCVGALAASVAGVLVQIVWSGPALATVVPGVVTMFTSSLEAVQGALAIVQRNT